MSTIWYYRCSDNDGDSISKTIPARSCDQILPPPRPLLHLEE